MVKLNKRMMIETNLSLVVPLDRKMRDDIRQKVERFFSMNKTIPPVSYHALVDFADALLVRNNWNKSYKAFVMVCCGNAIWRSVVGSVPYNRRMLLLPQCLKNSHMCKGREDELGLLCSDCGNCNISGFLSEAENLGYVTIVAEGTTIAARLVESGKVDAIIGVGCLEVLQKIFTAVNKYSLPAIGVPLLSCGCIDTIADTEWIREEIRNLNQHSGFRLLNLNNLREKTASLFAENRINTLLNLSGSATDKLVLECLLAGGKRIRPLLTVLAYEAFSDQPDSNLVQHLALSVECFHKASLIHDDIEDNDSLRYGKETVHTRYGIPVAINLGDLLIGEGYRLIAECNLAPEVIRDCLRVVSQGHKALSVGQGTELMARYGSAILSLKDILTVFENKTAAAFKVSLLLGAVAGGADEKTLTLLDHFSYLIGLAYQLKDDLEDFTVENGFTPFENPSVLIAMLAEKVSEADEQVMKEALLQNNAVSLQMLMQKYMIHELITNLLNEYLEKIDACLGNLQNIRMKLVLHEIVGKTFRDFI
jgi:geranylgeranyl diphosphate synthase type II